LRPGCSANARSAPQRLWLPGTPSTKGAHSGDSTGAW
jgi:hypothetical protein